MAKFYPAWTEIFNPSSSPLPQGDRDLLNILEYLPNDYTVLYQPHTNYAHPDVVILRKDIGALIIEVCDIDVNEYVLHSEEQPSGRKEQYLTHISDPKAEILSPFKEVVDYREEFYQCFIPELIKEKNRLKQEFLNHSSERETVNSIDHLVNTAVYFCSSSYLDVTRFFSTHTEGELINYTHRNGSVAYWGFDTAQFITRNIQSFLLSGKYYRNNKLFNCVQNFLIPPSDAWLEQQAPFQLDSTQQTLAKSHMGLHTRVKGVAGSGKTLIIAQKSINCYESKKQPILILTFNITLCTYIRNAIIRNTRGMSFSERATAFQILHFEGFIKQIFGRIHLKKPNPDRFEDSKTSTTDWEKYLAEVQRILKNNQDRLLENNCRYTTILVDEAQDQYPLFFDIIYDYFLAPNGEYMVAADEKQNLYNRPTENTLPRVRGMKGPWKELKKSYRLAPTTTQLAQNFQRTFMSNRYTLDSFLQTSIFDIPGKLFYAYLSDFSTINQKIVALVNTICKNELDNSINDICILTQDCSSIRSLDYAIRRTSGINFGTCTMCETQEEYDTIIKYANTADPDHAESARDEAEKDLNAIRHQKKMNFSMNTGNLKICTIHSFKGWEIKTVILLLDGSTKHQPNDELIYTAITRAKENLIVLNCGNNTYHDFFKENATHILTFNVQ